MKLSKLKINLEMQLNADCKEPQTTIECIGDKNLYGFFWSYIPKLKTVANVKDSGLYSSAIAECVEEKNVWNLTIISKFDLVLITFSLNIIFY